MDSQATQLLDSQATELIGYSQAATELIGDELGEEDDFLAFFEDLNVEDEEEVEPIQIQDNYIELEGVKINFPFPAYESQKNMMISILNGVKNGKNCLLESPTGTGKTAAILCSLLSWQKEHLKKGDNCTCDFFINDPGFTYETSRQPPFGVIKIRKITEPEQNNGKIENNENVAKEKDDVPAVKRQKIERQEVVEARDYWDKNNPLCSFCLDKFFSVIENARPKIFYATRTLTQVKQAIKQIDFCKEYNQVKMTILASRLQTCLNDKLVEKDPENLDTNCLTLKGNYYATMTIDNPLKEIEENGIEYEIEPIFNGPDTTIIRKGKLVAPVCKYFGCGGGERSSFLDSRNQRIWDIEDLRIFGRETHTCPYYFTRNELKNADIVFCTYNYLLMPGIRNASKIDLANSIVVFDEAHNIEDLCREIATNNISIKKLKDILDALIKINIESSYDGHIQVEISRATAKIDNFFKIIKSKAEEVENNFKNSTQYKTIQTEDMLKILKDSGLSRVEIEDFKDLKELLEKNEIDVKSKMFRRDKKIFLSQYVRRWINSFYYKLKFYYNNTEEYSCIAIKEIKSTWNTKIVNLSFRFICLNPSIAFRHVKNRAHSVILTSGTLSPLSSFESELDTKFEYKMQAPHVVQENSFWVGAISTHKLDYPNSPAKFLKMDYVNQRDENVKKVIGDAILKICQAVPKGILVFIPSYRYLNDLKETWDENGYMRKIQNEKKCFFEGGNKEQFKKSIEDYVAAIRDETCKGAIYFAVYRGKVSEGIDFRDDLARAVITIGIPLASCFEPSIQEKKKFNDNMRKVNQDFLNGNQWYRVNGMRALNQALGRCIRHSKDWGSVIFLEERVENRDFKPLLPKWLEKFCKPYSKLDEAIPSIRQFVETNTQDSASSGFIE